MDSDDEKWISSQPNKNITINKFEYMMDRLEKSSSQKVLTLNEAKALLKEDDELMITVYDYWVEKRIKEVCNQQKLYNTDILANCKKNLDISATSINIRGSHGKSRWQYGK
jgi:hypothetical protein